MSNQLKNLMEPPIEDPKTCYNFAVRVIGGRWEEAEDIIMSNEIYRCFYTHFIMPKDCKPNLDYKMVVWTTPA